VVHDETGLLIDVGDVDALTEALCRLAADAGLRSSMGAAGCQRVASMFDARRNAAQLTDLFIDIHARHSSR
jgi:glycosyltransferase involved in cell wall biosynthesis